MTPADLTPDNGDSVLLPTTYDVIWSLIPLVMLVFAWALITIFERKRGSHWRTVLLWCLLTLVLPVAGFVIWLVYVAVNYPRSPAGTTTGPGETTAEGGAG